MNKKSKLTYIDRDINKDNELRKDIVDSNWYIPVVLWITCKIKLKSNKKFSEKIRKIYVSQSEDIAVNKYVYKKFLDVWLIITVIGILAAVSSQEKSVNKAQIKDNKIERSEYQGSEKAVEVDTLIGNNNHENIVFEVAPNRLSQMQIEDLIEDVKNEVDNEMLLDNDNLESIKGRLNLITEYKKDNNVDIQWEVPEECFINYDGEIVYSRLAKYVDVTQYVQTIIKLKISYDNYECEYEYKVGIQINDDIKSRIIKCELENDINNQNNQYSADGVITLPGNIYGEDIEYFEKEDKQEIGSLWIWIAVLAISVVFIAARMEVDKSLKSRNDQLKMDYSSVVNKFALLIGAGMTVNKAWKVMCKDYIDNNKSTKKRYVYEEMIYTRNMIVNGESERIAYVNFGKRIG